MAEKHPKRPRDPNQLAKLIADIATGEAADEAPVANAKSSAGKKGGAARSAALTEEQRSRIAQIAASARWKKG